MSEVPLYMWVCKGSCQESVEISEFPQGPEQTCESYWTDAQFSKSQVLTWVFQHFELLQDKLTHKNPAERDMYSKATPCVHGKEQGLMIFCSPPPKVQVIREIVF